MRYMPVLNYETTNLSHDEYTNAEILESNLEVGLSDYQIQSHQEKQLVVRFSKPPRSEI